MYQRGETGGREGEEKGSARGEDVGKEENIDRGWKKKKKKEGGEGKT